MRFKPQKKQYPLPPKGNRPARCYAVIDCGTQPGGQYEPSRKIKLGFELVGTEIPNDPERRPFTVHSTFTLSYGPKAKLRAFLLAWRGVDIDADERANGVEFGTLLNRACMVNIVHKPSPDGERTYANIASIMDVEEGRQLPPCVNPCTIFSLDEPDWIVFERLPDFLKQIIQTSPEYQRAKNGQVDPVADDDYGDVPPQGANVDDVAAGAVDEAPF